MLSAFLCPWLGHPESHDTIEDYYVLHSKALERNNISLIFTLENVLGFMMFISLEQIVIYPEDWKCVEIYYNNAEPTGYNIVPNIII